MTFVKGNIPWSKGKKIIPQKSRSILCACGCGERFNKFDSRNRIRRYKVGHYKDGFKGRILGAHTGHTHTLQTRLLISKNRKGKTAKENNPAWKGGKKSQSDIIRSSFKYIEWRKKVFQRDNFTCQTCGQRGGTLEAHHIKPFAYFPKK